MTTGRPLVEIRETADPFKDEILVDGQQYGWVEFSREIGGFIVLGTIATLPYVRPHLRPFMSTEEARNVIATYI